MMKQFKYIVVLAALAVGLPVLAQEPGLEPERVYTHVDTVTMGCTPSNQPFSWRGHSIKRITGYYHDTVQASVVEEPYTIYYNIHTLHLIVKSYIKTDTAHISACEYEKPYYWNGKPYYNSGKFTDTIKVDDPATKDTICYLDLKFMKSIELRVSFGLCPGDSLLYRGKYYSKETKDTIYLTNPSGCDSTLYIYVSMKSSPVTMTTVHIKKGESYTWMKSKSTVVLTKDGWYDDTLKNVEGCDSITRLHLVTDYHMYQTSTFCEGDTLYYKNNKIYQSCVIHDTLFTIYGGDSITHMTFNMRNRPVIKEPFYYCKNDFPLPWPGHEKITFKGPGLYKDYRPSVIDTVCDSIFIADVKEFKPAIIDSTVTLIKYKDSLPYIWTDKYGVNHSFFHTADTVDTLGHTVVDTIPTFHGCDSILQLHVHIVEHFGYDTLPLCPGGEVLVNKQKYTAPGDYEQLLQRSKASTFNDSILYIHIVPAELYYNDVWDAVTICQSEVPYKWYHRVCMTSGEYQDTIPSLLPMHCDSIVHLRLTVLPTYRHVTNIYVCAGERAEYGGKQFELGWYPDTVKAINGCDSINILNFIEEKPWFRSDTAYFLAGGTYKWHFHGRDTILTQAGLYHDSCTTVHGCDSIYRLLLVEKQTYFLPESASICANETYRWHNKILTETGVYYDSTSTWLGADSIYELTLTVYPTYVIDSVIYACGGTSVVVGTGKKTFTQNGIYRDTLYTNHSHCDSVIVYNIKFIESNVIYTEGHLGKTGSYTWVEVGETLTQPGTYTRSIPSVRFGCDSITYKLWLIKDENYTSDTTVTICDNESYRWHDKTYKVAGDYTWNGVSQYGMDSIEHLHLFVNPTKEISKTIDKCQGQSLLINNQAVSQSGIYKESLLTSLGCDSTITWVVNFHPTYYHCDTIHFVEGTSVEWHGRTYTEQGRDTIHYTTSVCQCDSDYSVILIPSKNFSWEQSDTVCENQLPYIWHGQEIYESGDYEDRHLSVLSGLQADSSYYLHLTVVPKYTIRLDTTICPGGKIKFYTQTISQTGTYTETLLSKYGCDSIIELHVNPAEPKVTYETIHGCNGQTITVNGNKFTQSGEYEYIDKTATGCDSIIHVTIQIERSYFIDTLATINTGSSFIWKGHKNDIRLSKEGVYMDSLTTVNGCDSIYRLTLKVNQAYYFEKDTSICKSEVPFIWRGNEYYQSGTYYDSLATQSVGLDSVYCLKLEIRDATLVYRTIHACQGEVVEFADSARFTKSGVHDVTDYEQACPQTIRYSINFHETKRDTTRAYFCENGSYEWKGHFNDTVLTQEGIYEDYHKSVSDCDSMYVLWLTHLTSYLHDTTIYVCKEETPYTYKGQSYNTNMDFYDTAKTVVSKCDSIHVTRFRLNDKCSTFEQYWRCPNEPLYIDNREITADGEYRIPLTQDSIHRFWVHSYPSYEYITPLEDACDSVTYNGTTYHARSNNDTIIDVRRMKTIHGCDSIQHVIVVLHQTAAPKTNYQEIYDYGYVLFDGWRYDQTGIYTHKNFTSYGCDSVVSLNLTVVPTEHPGSMRLYYCSGEKTPLNVFGKNYHPTKDTIIIDTIRYEGFGMMKIQTATVYVTSPFTITSVDMPDEICSDNPTMFYIYFDHKGSYPTNYELTFLPNQLVASPNPQKGDINGKGHIEVEMTSRGTYVSPGEYPYQLRFHSDQCSMSDTAVFGTILVRYPQSIMESYWDNTVALVNQNYNVGGWLFQPPYNWQIFNANGEDKTAWINPNQNQSYISSNTLAPGDRIVVSPLRVGYNKVVPSCEYIFTYAMEEGREPVLVYPTAVRKSAHVTIESNTTGEYGIYNDTGERLNKGRFEQAKQTVQMPASEGCYLLYIHTQDRGTQIHKIIVY